MPLNNIYHVQVTCPYCGRKSIYTMKTLVDTGVDPHAEANLFNGSMFAYQCPFCHEEQGLSYSCLYHDKARKLLIGYADNAEDKEEMCRELTGEYQGNELDEALKKWAGTCTKRLVTSVSDLQEKVLIFHFNLDDRLIEIGKYMIRMIAEEQPDLHAETLYFNHSDHGYSFVIASEEGTDGEIPFSKENYLLLERKYGQLLLSEDELQIDQSWAEQFIHAHDAA
jgi:hypothetical protein